MTNEEFFAKIKTIITLATGVPECILADQRSTKGDRIPAPSSGPYASVTPRQSVSERGQANIYATDIPDNKVQVEVRAQIMCSCSVNFYRGDALLYAERLKQANKRPDVSMMLYKAGIGWNGTDAINNLTALQSGNFEQRAQITLRLMYESSSIAEVNNILQASVAMQNQNGEVLESFDVVLSNP